MSERKEFETSELYDKLKEQRGTYILCTDLCNLKNTNDMYGNAAGDLLIAEAARRIDNEITKEIIYIPNKIPIFDCGKKRNLRM